MVIVHIVEPFAAGIAVFVKSLTEAMPDDVHIVVHGERKKEMTIWDLLGMYSWHGLHHVTHISRLRENMEWDY